MTVVVAPACETCTILGVVDCSNPWRLVEQVRVMRSPAFLPHSCVHYEYRANIDWCAWRIHVRCLRWFISVRRQWPVAFGSGRSILGRSAVADRCRVA